jgi:hypothetical protein
MPRGTGDMASSQVSFPRSVLPRPRPFHLPHRWAAAPQPGRGGSSAGLRAPPRSFDRGVRGFDRPPRSINRGVRSFNRRLRRIDRATRGFDRPLSGIYRDVRSFDRPPRSANRAARGFDPILRGGVRTMRSDHQPAYRANRVPRCMLPRSSTTALFLPQGETQAGNPSWDLAG